MARPLRIEFEGAFYHIIQRGIERKNIFVSDKDKEKFLSYLSASRKAYGAIIHAYTLMNNHYHLILETPRGNLSKIMHFINTSYAAFFNTRRKRVGPLYQGRYKSILVQQDGYLHHLSRYVHLNPVRAGLVKDPKDYFWSSCKYYISNITAPEWLNITLIFSMFHTNKSKAMSLYKQFILEGIGKEKDIIKENTIKGFILGDYKFFEDIINRFVDNKITDPEIHVLKDIESRKEPTLEHIKSTVEKTITKNMRHQRRFSLYLSRTHTQQSLNQIASFYGKITDAGVSQAARRVEEERKKDKSVDKLLRNLEDKINLSRVET